MPENPKRHRARSRTNAATQERNDGRSGGGGSAGLEEEKFRNWWRNGRGTVMCPRWQRGRRRQAHGIWQNNRRRERHVGANGTGLIGRPGPVVLYRRGAGLGCDDPVDAQSLRDRLAVGEDVRRMDMRERERELEEDGKKSQPSARMSKRSTPQH